MFKLPGISYEEFAGKALSVIEIFNDFFGEDKVDATIVTKEQYDNNKEFSDIIDILIWFPTITIKDSYDNEHIIRDLYVKINIEYNGCLSGYFTVVRATYTDIEAAHNYIHSHAPMLYGHDSSSFFEFKDMCTGTGPIRNTEASLLGDYDEDLWYLFCLELDKYLKVESTFTAPYIKISSLSDKVSNKTPIEYYKPSTETLITCSEEYKNMLCKFIEDLCKQNILKFCYSGNSITIAMSPTEYILAISDYFIEWYNTKAKQGVWNNMDSNDLFTRGILKKATYNGVSLETLSENSVQATLPQYIGSTVLTFKGKEIPLTIIDSSIEGTSLTIISPSIAFGILYSILISINYNYRNDGYISKLPDKTRFV